MNNVYDRTPWVDDYAFLNSITKYPSITTWHVMADKGRLTTETQGDPAGPWELTEKIDGTNARIVVLTWAEGCTTWFIGSREELLWASGDRLHNKSMGIVDVVRPLASEALSAIQADERTRKIVPPALVVFYGEVFGHGINHWQPYTAREGVRGFRVFDIQNLKLDVIEQLWREDPAGRSLWREGNDSTRWVPSGLLREVVGPHLTVVPSMGWVETLPVPLDGTLEWLTQGDQCSGAVLDDTPPLTDRRPEGVVARTKDRSRIVKLRVEDYERARLRK